MGAEVEVASDLNLLASFLARRDVKALSPNCIEEAIDWIIVCACAPLITVDVAVKAVQSFEASRLLICGGVGHSTELLRDAVRSNPAHRHVEVGGRSEADIFRDLIVGAGIDPSRIVTENQSTNCGANAWEAKRVLRDLGEEPRTVVLIQDPTMQRRTQASFERAWREEREVRFISFAPFIPEVQVANGEPCIYPEGQWTLARFVSLVLGEVPRLHDSPGGYGPTGKDFIEHVDVPEDVLSAHGRLSIHFQELTDRR